MKNKVVANLGKIISIVLPIFWAILIFVLSSFTGGKSSSQSSTIVSIIIKIHPFINENILTFLVRKLAHFFEYFIFTVLIANALKTLNKNISWAALICILYAISDEIHQNFVPGREGRIFDVLVDTLGGLFAILILFLIKKTLKKLTVKKIR